VGRLGRSLTPNRAGLKSANLADTCTNYCLVGSVFLSHVEQTSYHASMLDLSDVVPRTSENEQVQYVDVNYCKYIAEVAGR
jgi:hypothetical protein